MKRIVLSIVLLVALLGTSIVYAMETTTYSGLATFHDRFVSPFITLRDGNITAIAYFSPKNTVYTVYIHAGNSIYDGPYCVAHVDDRLGQNIDQVTCTINNAPAGNYKVEFYPSSGKVLVTIDVIAETN